MQGTIEDFVATNLSVSRKLHTDEGYLDKYITMYFMKVLPVLGWYDEEQVEASFAKAREREEQQSEHIRSIYFTPDK